MASRGRRGGASAREDEPRRGVAGPGTARSCTSPTAACGLQSIHARSGASHADVGSYPGSTPGTVGGLG
ncbi:hypothetical protein Taro_034474 [Colocasia esculenta]|uniref:Uncharacterized protein n=1 Tax=Colocasia esculenta TaxID=4460 RepID=A0A843W0X9_COLES|nr:hypothetical protein [Colocasia esculenta]